MMAVNLGKERLLKKVFELKKVLKNDQIIGTYKINEVDGPIRIE